MNDFKDDCIIKPIKFNNENDSIVFSMKGNYIDENNNYISTETLYNAWKDYIGKEITNIDKYRNYILCGVDKKDDLIFLRVISKGGIINYEK